jgi:hypothetical protein
VFYIRKRGFEVAAAGLDVPKAESAVLVKNSEGVVSDLVKKVEGCPKSCKSRNFAGGGDDVGKEGRHQSEGSFPNGVSLHGSGLVEIGKNEQFGKKRCCKGMFW